MKGWKALRPALIVAAVLALAVAVRYFHPREFLLHILDRIAGLGAWGVLLFIVAYILACIFFLPGSVLGLGAGVIFGTVKGTVIVSLASILGATTAFLIGRYIARDWVAKKIGDNPKFKAIDEAVGRQGWKIVVLTRLSPLFPFNLLNYAYALTKVSLRDYFFASWIGMLPGTAIYVYLGSLAGDLAGLSAGARTRTTAEWLLYLVGFIATVVVSLYVARLARAALKEIG